MNDGNELMAFVGLIVWIFFLLPIAVILLIDIIILIKRR